MTLVKWPFVISVDQHQGGVIGQRKYLESEVRILIVWPQKHKDLMDLLRHWEGRLNMDRAKFSYLVSASYGADQSALCTT